MVSLLVINLVDTQSISPDLQACRTRRAAKDETKAEQSPPQIFCHGLEATVETNLAGVVRGSPTIR